MKINSIISKYDGFIFDFDGVIVDSLGIKAEAFGLLFEDLGPAVMAEVRAYHLSHGGVSRYKKFEYYYRTFRGREITLEESAALDKKYSDLVVSKVVAGDAIPGVMDVLQAIRTAGKVCYVVSATPEAEIRHIVEARGLGSFFKDVLGSPCSKTDNVGVLIRKHGLTMKRLVYFGDAKSDLEAAQAHRVDFIGVVYGESTELKAIQGIEVIPDFQ